MKKKFLKKALTKRMLMKIGLLKEKSSEFQALKNLACWEGVEFKEISKAGREFDAIISVKPAKCECWNLCFSKSKKTGIKGRKYFLDSGILESAANAFSFRENNKKVSGSEIFLALDFIAKSLGKGFETKWFFPVAKEFAAMVSHDIDFQANYQNLFMKNKVLAKIFAKMPKAAIAKAFRKIPRKKRYGFFPSVLSFDEAFGFKASVFLRAEKYMLEEEITGRGKYGIDEGIRNLNHSIGVHFGATLGNYSEGFVRTDVYGKPEIPWIKGISESRKEIEKFAKTSGCRTHHHHFFAPQSMQEIEKAGFLYDSSLFPEILVHFKKEFSEKSNKVETWKPFSNCRIAFHPLFKEKAFGFFELPVTIMECHEKEKIKESVSESKKNNGIANALYHPSVDVRGLVWFLEECKSQNAWITTMEEFSQWFVKREKMPLYEAPLRRISGFACRKEGLKKCGKYWLESKK